MAREKGPPSWREGSPVARKVTTSSPLFSLMLRSKFSAKIQIVVGGKLFTLYLASLHVQDDMIIAKEEIFGPVMCLMKFT